MALSSCVVANAPSMRTSGLRAIPASKAAAAAPRAVTTVLLLLCCCGALVSPATSAAANHLDTVWQIPKQSTSNTLNNYIAAYLSKAIYNENNFCPFVKSTFGAGSCVLLSAFNVKYSVLTSGSGSRVFVVIRGTDNPDNWIRANAVSQVLDLSAATILGTASATVGSGFLTAFTSMAPGLVGAIGKNNTKDVFVMGHSLGGALSSIATQYLVANGYRVKGVYTLGSPYVGKIAWSTLYNSNRIPSFRLYHPGDCVPAMPLKSLKGPEWIHVGYPIKVPACKDVSKDIPCGTPSLKNLFTFVKGCVAGCQRLHTAYVDNTYTCVSVFNGDWFKVPSPNVTFLTQTSGK